MIRNRERHPTRRDRAPPGPLPTLAETARMFGWCWCRCPMPCGHSAAIPLDTAVTRLGAQATTDDLCARLVCTVCGRRRATLRMPSWGDIGTGYLPIPIDEVAVGLREGLGLG